MAEKYTFNAALTRSLEGDEEYYVKFTSVPPLEGSALAWAQSKAGGVLATTTRPSGEMRGLLRVPYDKDDASMYTFDEVITDSFFEILLHLGDLSNEAPEFQVNYPAKLDF